jgi:hypothetical protein
MTGDGPRFALVVPETVEAVETYRCQQEICRNPSLAVLEGEARGEVWVVAPLEGLEGIDLSDAGGGVRIGHLVLHGTERTDLDRVLPEANRFGALPLVLAAGPEAPRAGLRSAVVLGVEYTPEVPEIPPLEVRMDLMDADAADGEWVDLGHREPPAEPGRLKSFMRGRSERDRGLLLGVEVRVGLPRERLEEALGEPSLRAEVELRWPIVPAPESACLRWIEAAKEGDTEPAQRLRSIPVPYDPLHRSLRWPRLELTKEGGGATDCDFAFFSSKKRFLLIDRAEDLAGRTELEARVEVVISNLLLSGLQVRSFRADGHLDQESQVACTTRIVSDVSLILDDAVRCWRRSPVQHLHFENVILDEMRVQDVRMSLQDMGFEVQGGRTVALGGGGYLVRAHRAEGAERLWLWVYLTGDRSTTERKTELGGQTYTTQVRSGDVEVTIRGQLNGDPRPVLEDIHSLHERLRHQFQVTMDRR